MRVVKEWTEDWALWHAAQGRLSLRHNIINFRSLLSISQVWSEPGVDYTSNTIIFNLANKISWLTVSKAFLRSMKTPHEPHSGLGEYS